MNFPRWLLIFVIVLVVGVLGGLTYWLTRSSAPTPANQAVDVAETSATPDLPAKSDNDTLTETAVATITIPECLEPPMTPFSLPETVAIRSEAMPVSPATAVETDPLARIQPAGSLLAYWPFAGGDGLEVFDLSGNEHTGSLNRPDMQRADVGQSGAALAFQNPDDSFVIAEPRPEGFLHQPFLQRSVAMWIKADDLLTPQILYDEGDGHNGLALRLNNGHLEVRVVATNEGETLAAVGSHSFPGGGAWQHITAVFNAGVLILYLDGEPVTFIDNVPFAVVQAHGDGAAVGASNGPNAFGDHENGATFQGLLDDVRIYGTEYFEPLAPDAALEATLPTATPAMAPTSAPANSIAATAVASSPGLSSPSLPLFDLPFPYDGGNENFGGNAAQFRQASQGPENEGRINGYFDHLYPLYPAPQAGKVTNGREPATVPYGGQMLSFDGLLRPTIYSGHPGFDFAPYERRQPTTPLFAAADGVVQTVAIHGKSGAYFIEILHETETQGSYQTRYWHLQADEHFAAMADRVGQPIQAGERIGTIGNTGWSTGHHLHFEIRYDHNNDGEFLLNETVDPFGFIPSAAYPEDPWQKSSTFIDGKGNTNFHPGSPSRYLWKHPLGTAAQMPQEGGGQLKQFTLSDTQEEKSDAGGSEICVPRNALPPGSNVNWSWIPDPPPSPGLVGTGHGCVLSVFEPDGSPVTRFAAPVRIVVPFNEDDLFNVADPQSSLALYWQRPGSADYERLETTIDFDAGLATAVTEYPGSCALLGLPNRDLVAPQTIIQAQGPHHNDGPFNGPVTVSLENGDDDVALTEYSLDGGHTWQPYTGPFAIPADTRALGAPDLLPDEEGVEGLLRGPGRYLVLAAARDLAGNEEYPPVAKIIYIEPVVPTATPTPLAMEPVTSTATATPFIENAVCEVIANSVIRQAPDAACVVLQSALPGDLLPINGRNKSGNWYLVRLANGLQGWIAASSCTAVATAVPLADNIPAACTSPTPTMTVTPLGTATTTTTPSATAGTPVIGSGDVLNCHYIGHSMYEFYTDTGGPFTDVWHSGCPQLPNVQINGCTINWSIYNDDVVSAHIDYDFDDHVESHSSGSFEAALPDGAYDIHFMGYDEWDARATLWVTLLNGVEESWVAKKSFGYDDSCHEN